MIKGNSIRTAARVIVEAKGAETVLFVIRRDSIPLKRQEQIGLHHLVKDGDTILPAAVGRVSDYNSSGKEKKRRDLPLIKKSIPQYRSWKDWHGKEHDGIQHRTMHVYPIDFLNLPSEKLFLKLIDNIEYIVTREIDLNEDHASFIHMANLLLEYFEEFEVFDVKKHKITNVPFRQLQWDILPPGKYPWNKSSKFVTPYLSRLNPSEKGVIEFRMREISCYEPDFLATGRGGYSGYFVYGFSDKGLFFLESIHLNNATYVFGNDWEELSILTKEEIINGPHAHKRVIHDKSWIANIRKLLRG